MHMNTHAHAQRKPNESPFSTLGSRLHKAGGIGRLPSRDLLLYDRDVDYSTLSIVSTHHN